MGHQSNPMNPRDWMEILDVVHQSNPMNPRDWMEILDVVHQSNPMESTGRVLGPWKSVQLFRALKELENSPINTVKSYLLKAPTHFLLIE